MRSNLIAHGFGNYTETFLTSGFGDENKARAFMEADKKFQERTGYKLFSAVGVGEVSKAIFATADIFEVNGKPFSKVGREIPSMDYSTLRRVI